MMAEPGVLGWCVAAFAALCVGLGKGGVPGLGLLPPLLFAWVFPAKASVGLLLPVLMAADVLAVWLYRDAVDWRHVRRFLPPMLVGILVGWGLFDQLSDQAVRQVIGGTLLVLVVLQAVLQRLRKARATDAPGVSASPVLAIGLGGLGGLATMLANASGPIGQLYLLLQQLPVRVFVGTAAWIFFLANVFKVPLQVELGLLSPASFSLSASFMPCALLGAWLGPRVLARIEPRLFARLVMVFVVVAALQLLWTGLR